MAHQREKEETELKLPKTISVCVPTIPVSPQLSGADDQAQAAASSSAGSSARSDPKDSDADDSRSGAARSPERSDPVVSPPKRPEAEAEAVNRPLKRPREVNRCSGDGCRRKVGLIGFRCRCGEVFCSEHRYSDRHDCTFDYKAAGREAIARENPVVRAAKILKV
ncbi:PREDICTED: zinc finger A20 and AN1 domain-containing stress-associated protein 5-like [Ipomoea nil]|uniref:zinc finger A20 and AN1 domain-containing stress-associated protein 5-like n=1 Tax=Ipomoea nil TaxID=35883 RepID=UPI0009016720|nr:PREDICTED: zinc finger A20 and AN1 domain-containing stress-associated protein 5-like [Ipomoea nil]